MGLVAPPDRAPGAGSTLQDLAFIALAACGVPLLLFVALGAVLTGGPSVAGAALVALVVAALLTVWRLAKRTPRGRGGPLGALRRLAQVALLMTAVPALTALVASGLAFRPPSQDEIVSQFAEHRMEYEALRDMAAADGLARVSDAGGRFSMEGPFPLRTPDAVGISQGRATEYQRLLKAAGASGLSVSPDGSVLFPVAGWGMANRGWRLALMWSKREPDRLVASLDGLSSTQGQPVATRIEGDWYVSFIW
jgi:hypothetical protein